MKMESMYEQLGVSAAVYEYGERIIAELRDRFDAIDQTAEYNQAKVLSAMQKNRVNAIVRNNGVKIVTITAIQAIYLACYGVVG